MPARSMRILLAWVVGIALGAVPARAEGDRQSLRDAGPAAVGAALTRLFGAPVEVRGGAGRAVSLELPAGPRDDVLDRAARALGGTWRRKLRVRSGAAGTLTRPAPELARRLFLGATGVPAERALSLVARALGIDLELEGAVTGRVDLPAASLPAAEILDQVARQAGLSWTLVYVIEAPDAPLRPSPPAPETPFTSPARAVPAAAAADPIAPSVPAAVSGADLRSPIAAAIARLVRAPADRRAEEVRAFTMQIEPLLSGVRALPPAQRRERVAVLRAILPAWIRFYRGLAPDAQRQLQPAQQLLDGLGKL